MAQCLVDCQCVFGGWLFLGLLTPALGLSLLFPKPPDNSSAHDGTRIQNLGYLQLHQIRLIFVLEGPGDARRGSPCPLPVAERLYEGPSVHAHGGVAHTQFPEEVPGLSDTHRQDPGHGDVSMSLDARPAAGRRFLFVAAEFCCDVHL